MLQRDLIHGDLSAYNILYWQGSITLIDFPQVVNGRTNPRAHFILKRDIERVCEYFARQGVQCQPRVIMNDLWSRFLAVGPEEQAADESRLEWEEDRDAAVPEEREQWPTIINTLSEKHRTLTDTGRKCRGENVAENYSRRAKNWAATTGRNKSAVRTGRPITWIETMLMPGMTSTLTTKNE